jgi:hypothetical protein
MSVLACNRTNCTQIMCGRYSFMYGHICYECFDELVSRGPATSISKFMASSKPDRRDKEHSYHFFDNAFRSLDDG